jgi:hypothetical protein
MRRGLVILILILTRWNLFGNINDTTAVKSSDPVLAKKESTRSFGAIGNLSEKSELDPIILPKFVFEDSIEHHRANADAFNKEVKQKNAFVTTLTPLALMTLPVGLQRQVGGINYTIIISKIESTPAGSFLEAFMMLDIPQSGDKIAFRGANIPFSNTGGLKGIGRLELIGSYPVRISDKTLMIILGKGNTFVEFDCNGFKEFSIEADVEFSRELIIPEDEKGVQQAGRVKTNFVVRAQSWSDILIGVNLPPFQINGLKDVGFSVSQAYLDWSDIANPPGVLFPEEYSSPFIQSGHHTLWQGVFLRRLSVRLPTSFVNKNSKGRITFGAENMLLDDQGFTGAVFAENVLSTGDMSGWSYTIDQLNLNLVINQVKAFGIIGKIGVPRVKTRDGAPARFAYRAHRAADGNYLFAVDIQDSLQLPFLYADLNLYPGSSVQVKQTQNQFFPTAILNGELSIKSLEKGPKTKFSKIRFEGMKISSEEPTFDIRTLGVAGNEQQTISKFPVTINGIAVRKETNRIGLNIDVTINIGGKTTEEGFGGGANVTIWAKQEQTPVKDAEGATIRTENEWTFDKVELSGISIQIKKADVFELKGTITYFEADRVYGDGFSGELSGSIGKMGNLSVTAVFGKTETFRYWYADAMAQFKSGVPIIPGALFATGFGGGLYSKMKQTEKPVSGSIGKTASGVFYVPDENSMGIRAIMKIGTIREEAMNGDVGLEIVMNRHGGINSVTLSGNAYFMSLAAMSDGKMKELMSSAAAGKLTEKLSGLMKGQVYGSMKLVFDNENDVFHGNLEIFVNVAGGLVKGIGEGSRAGWAVLHFEKSDWYVLIGTPDQPIGLEVAKIFKAKSYFMLGKNLPGSPPPPRQVTEIIGNVDLDYMRDMNALQSGTGFAFGLHFIVDTGDLRFLMFYGRFAAGTGVDFMLKDYGTQYHCAGSSGPIGINGWYANGQAYAFVMGKIGIKVNLKFYKGSYDILSIGAAAILQMKGPNPFWMKGTVAGDYRILGGMVKGHCSFDVTVGKDCKPMGDQNLLEDVNMIAEISPAKNSTNVDVFNAPQVAFNIPVNEIFEITDLENKTHFFRAKLDEFYLADNGRRIEGALQWNTTSDVVIFDGTDILPGEKKLTAKARLTFEERIGSVWTKVKFDGKIVEEIAETQFTTGVAPDHIPASNVVVTYPLVDQVNFHPREYNLGFIQLRDGQAYLFEPNNELQQKIRFTDVASQRNIESDLTYNRLERKVTFGLPTGFENSKEYQIEIINTYKEAAVIDANVQQIETELQGSENGGVTLTTKHIEGSLDKKDSRVLYTSNFRTSKYNTFVEKMRAITLTPAMRMAVDRYALVLSANIIGDEKFDIADITGSDKLIHAEANLVGNSWYDRIVYPLVYESYPYNGWRVSRSEPQKLGIPPVRDIVFNGFTQTENAFAALSFIQETVVYNLGESVDSDFISIKKQAANYVVDKPWLMNPRIEALLLGKHPFIRYGNYSIKLNYVIPGVAKTTSTYEWQIFNPIRDVD